jgi:hypothetical protein
VKPSSGENEWTTLEGFTLRNGAAQDGAGLACLYAATPRLSDLVIEDNAASATGGGVLCFFGAAPQFVRCVLRGNSAQSGAGAYTRLKSFPHFVSCRVVDNTAVLDGGGLYLGSWNSSDASLPALTEHVEGCVIADNHAGRDGGGALTWTNAADPPKRILCSTIAANQAGNRGGGVYTHANNSSYPIAASLSNTIVWANTAPTQAGVAYNASAPTLDHCDVQPGDPLGSSGISVDPEFLSPANGDFRVDCGSPVIDNGSTAALPPDVADLDGDGDSSEALPLDASGATRVTNGVVDIGAHEGPTLPETYCTAKTNSQGCVPAVGFSGSASTSSSSPFTISATNVLNLKSGLLFYGSGSNAAPFQGGTLCVQTPVRRTPIQSSNGNPPPEDCSGAYSLDFNALIQSSADPLLVPGARCFAQFWSRDPASPSTTGLTDALSFWICP